MRGSPTSLRLVTVISFLLGIVPVVFAIPATTVSFNLNDLDMSERDGFDVLDIEGCHLSGEPGLPLLPCKAVNFVISRGQGVARIRVEVEAKERLPGSYYIYPGQPDEPGYGEEDFVGPDMNVYGSSKPFPGSAVLEGQTTTAWGWKVCQVVVWPLEYIPADREIWLYESLKISLELSPSTENEQEILERSKEQHEEWAAELEQVVANPTDVLPLGPNDFSSLRSSHRWVLILPGFPAPGSDRDPDPWYSAFEPLINWRAAQGLDTYVEWVGNITTASGEGGVQDVRAYLKSQHRFYGARWACLAGDDEMIPWTYLNPPDVWRDVPSDWAYCDLDGDWPDDHDWSPELWVGRVPCLHPGEAANFVEKVLVYENPGYGNHAYLDSAFYDNTDETQAIASCSSVVEHQDPGIYDKIWRELPSWSHPDPSFPYSGHILSLLNSDRYHYISIHCHGVGDSEGDVRPDSFACLTRGNNIEVKSAFGPDEFESFANTGYYYFWYSISCMGAYLDYGDQSARSRAELSTCVYADRCAVAYGGNTRAGLLTASPDLQCCAWDLLFPNGPKLSPYFNHAGKIEAGSKWRMSVTIGTQFRHKYVSFSHNLFGDPATGIWTPRAAPSQQKPLAAGDQVIPVRIESFACVPNPVQERALLRFSLSHPSDVRLGLYDISGRLVSNLCEGDMTAGMTSWRWEVPSIALGAYVLRIKAGKQESARKIVVLE